MPQMMSARPRKGTVEIHPTSESTTELVHKNQDEVWMGRGAREGFLSFTAGKCAVTGAQPTPQQLPALHPATLCFAGDWMHRAVPTTTWQFPGLWEGMVSEHICTKKFQDLECIGGLELVLHQRCTNLSRSQMAGKGESVGKDSRYTQAVMQSPQKGGKKAKKEVVELLCREK